MDCIYVNVDFRPICTKIAQRGTLVPYSKGVATVVAGSGETIYELQNVTMKHPSPFFNEVSVGFHEFGEELKCLQWLPLVKLLDKYCVVPTVKCASGCSAFLSVRVRRLEAKNYFNAPYIQF